MASSFSWSFRVRRCPCSFCFVTADSFFFPFPLAHFGSSPA